MIWSIPLEKAYFCVNCEKVICVEGEAIFNGKCPCCGRGLVVPLAKWLNREESSKEVEGGKQES